MPRRTNVFGQPLSYDVGVKYVNGKPVDRNQPLAEGDDLSDATIQTAVQYVEGLTEGAEGSLADANVFPLVNSGAPTKVSLTGPDGNTPPLSEPPPAQPRFLNQTPTDSDGKILSNVLDSTSDSARQPNGLARPGDASFVKKGKSSSGLEDGNTLLRGAAAPSQLVSDLYVSPILSNNRFTSANVQTQLQPGKISASPQDQNAKRYNLAHDPSGLGSYGNFQKEQGGADLTDGHVASVGLLLTLRATKELNASSDTAYGPDGPDGIGASTTSLLPGGAQSGLFTVPADDLTAASALSSLIAGKTHPVNISEDASGPRQVITLSDSFGQYNNVLEPFSGLLPAGTVAAAAALAIALNVALHAALAVFLVITNASTSSSTKRDAIGRFVPGDSRFNPAFDSSSFPPLPLPAKLFGLLETSNPYGSAVDEGIKVFFGGSIGGQLQRVLESPGFYLTFCRTIIRSAADLALILKDLGRGNPLQVAENIVGFVEAVRASKAVAALNVFAQIGDASLLRSLKLSRLGTTSESVDGPRPADSDVDNMDGLDAMRTRKRGSLATAWGAGTTKSTYIMPFNVASAMLAGSPGSLTKLLSDRSNAEVVPVPLNRISKADVDRVESILDAEYVPFYFHDLRTNEIVSFNAFLANLSEAFAPNWDSVDGYGRVDAVKTYRNTSRKIGVDFYVAATNQEDFDAMWQKVNKLTTLVYPQWSAGTLLNVPTNNSKFVQPFSQVPSASPLIRVRVGDLWTSNYSKFALKRLFGFGSDNTFSVNGTQTSSPQDTLSKYTQIVSALQQRLGPTKDLPNESIWLLEPGDYDVSPQDQSGLGAAASTFVSMAASAVGVNVQTSGRVTARIRNYTRVKITKAADKTNGSAYYITLADSEGMPPQVANATFLVSRSHLSFADDTLTSLNIAVESSTAPGATSNTNNVDATSGVADFFSVDNNAIARAFEASSGRGLACFIDGMSFDWNNVPWETGEPGARAPKMCKVTVSMEVVHDVAPGLDSDGYNRAPLYSVGRLSNAMAGKNPLDPSKTKAIDAMNKLRRSLI